MTSEEKREKAIQSITGMLKSNPFTFEFKVKKNPQGIKVIYEVTQEELNAAMNKAAEKEEME